MPPVQAVRSLFLTFSLLPLLAAGQDHPQTPAWVEEAQTYAMVPLLPATGQKMNITVNGIWAGISSDHPILPSREMIPSVRKKYKMDVEAFVNDCHDSGLIVCGVINGIEGMDSLREKYPKLEEMACRRADGTPASNGDWLLMCTSNPDWIEVEYELGKRSIDDGADVLHLDTPMGAAFLSGGFLKAGFCDHCMERFKKHLETSFTASERKAKLGLEGFDRDSVIQRLRTKQELAPEVRPFVDETADDLLFREFIRSQEQASFDTRKQLLERLRQYAADKGRKVVFSTNAADLGTMNAFGHWIRGIMFADLVDFFVYEQDVLPNGFPGEKPMPLPRGKWAAYHKLAYAIHGYRSPATIHAGPMGKVLMEVMIWPRRTTRAWFGTLAAEAYAANGAFIIYHIEAPFGKTSGLDRMWKNVGELNGFVRKQAEYYRGKLRSGSPLAFVVLYGERGRTIPGVFPSYFGFAQACVEGCYPFDVVFGGDGHFVRDRLRQEQLSPYDTIVVPGPISPTENQKQVLREFVTSGGTLVAQEPDLLGITEEFVSSNQADTAGEAQVGAGRVLRLAGDVTTTATNDIGAEYFATYTEEVREKIHALLDTLDVPSLVSDCQEGTIGVFPVVQSQQHRIVIHFVNYDVDLKKDLVREKENVELVLPKTWLPAGTLSATYYTPAQEPQIVSHTLTNNTFRCAVPRLGFAGTLVVATTSK